MYMVPEAQGHIDECLRLWQAPAVPLGGPEAPFFDQAKARCSGKSYRSTGNSYILISGLQKGPAERGHIKKRQKSSKSFSTLFDNFCAGQKSSKIVKKFFDTFRQFSRRAKNVKNRQKVSKIFSTLFDNFRAAPFFRPLLGGSDLNSENDF